MLLRIGKTIRSCATLTRGRHGVVGGMDNVAWTRLAAQDESRAEALASARPFRSKGNTNGNCAPCGGLQGPENPGVTLAERRMERDFDRTPR